ncbi:MAG: hypothetical protein JWL84_2553 [Rhodospirillales bacterium]|jgi:hypothetical protein|nr:hypothetical protein [Rhodospirillales bacterium]
MTCLYASDYGAADPGFVASRAADTLIKGFESHAPLLEQAHNLGELLAIKRVLARGETVQWCNQGYGWTEGMQFHALFAAILVFALAYVAWRLRTHRAAARKHSPGNAESEMR